jgi:hypothetical protein
LPNFAAGCVVGGYGSLEIAPNHRSCGQRVARLHFRLGKVINHVQYPFVGKVGVDSLERPK